MTYRVFDIPEFHEFVDVLGIGPEPVEGGEAVRLAIDGEDEQLVVTLDPPGRSIHVRWTRGGALMFEAFREGAVGVRLGSVGESSSLAIEFGTDCQRGELQIQVSPTVELRDQLLFR